mmetsp:Transcript_11569/g.26373  ORF Transcript_11569/g.26373 Transcript_11569/m.26373 type:complete len:218 (-) Transcript_11569:46-699(-)
MVACALPAPSGRTRTGPAPRRALPATSTRPPSRQPPLCRRTAAARLATRALTAKAALPAPWASTSPRSDPRPAPPAPRSRPLPALGALLRRTASACQGTLALMAAPAQPAPSGPTRCLRGLRAASPAARRPPPPSSRPLRRPPASASPGTLGLTAAPPAKLARWGRTSPSWVRQPACPALRAPPPLCLRARPRPCVSATLATPPLGGSVSRTSSRRS